MSPAAPARRLSPADPRRGRGARATRPDLRRVEPRGRRRGRRVGPLLSLSVLVASLLTVVIGHAMLAQGQVRLAAAQNALSAAQAEHRQEVLKVAGLETPGRITDVATGTLAMVSPGQVNQLPYVPLNVPLHPPTLSGTASTPTTQPGQ